MATIDIPLPAELTQALTPPRCLNLQLPKPEIPTLKLPTGGTIKGVADFTRGIPTDCSMNFSLILQIAPIMASMECLLKVLKFLGGIINAATQTPPNPLVLIARLLHCTIEALQSVVNILGGLQLDIASALQEGNDDKLAALQCAQENAGIAADSTMKSLEPIL